MSCRACGHLLFPEYGEGDELCAACEERREPADVIARDRAIQPKPGEEWVPVVGRIGGTGFGSLAEEQR